MKKCNCRHCNPQDYDDYDMRNGENLPCLRTILPRYRFNNVDPNPLLNFTHECEGVSKGIDLLYGVGKLHKYAWPGGYPIFYYAADFGIFCPDCANGENGSEAFTNSDYEHDDDSGYRMGPDSDPTCPDDQQWYITRQDINYEDQHMTCSHCEKVIEAAYDPDPDPGFGI